MSTPSPSSAPSAPAAPDTPPTSAAPAENPSGKGQRALYWLAAIFVIIISLVMGLRGFFADLQHELHQRTTNERARLFIGEEIIHSIQQIEGSIYRMAITQNSAGFLRVKRDIVAHLDKVRHDLTVLQKGGTSQRALRLNLTDQEEVNQEVRFQPTDEDDGYVMEQIEVGSKLDQVQQITNDLELLLTKRWEAIEADNPNAFYETAGNVALLLKQTPPYFERLHENANRLFVDGEKRLARLEMEIDGKREFLSRLETVLIALVIFLAAALGFLFLRRLNQALDEARRFGKEVARQRERNATILDTLSDGVYATDAEGRITFLNAAAERMFAWPAAELLGRPAHAATHYIRPNGAHYPIESCPLLAVQHEGIPASGNEWFVDRSGHCFPVSYRANPLLQDGQVVGTLVSFQDISARRAAEARIKLLETAIEESDQGILITSADANEDGPTIQYVNSGFTKITGHTALEAVGRRTALLRGPNSDPATILDLVVALQTGKRFTGPVDYQRKDGTLLAAEIDYSPVHNEQGELSHFIALISDVGMRRAAEQALREAHDQALENARLKSEFLANMSHEIRTPMNGIIGMTDLLLDTPLNGEQQEFAQLVRDSAHSLLTIINDILDFSKIEAGKLDIEMVDFSLPRVVEGVVDLLAPKAQEKGLSLMSFVDPALAGLRHGDSTRLRQILLNLTGNAVKFTQQGGVEVLVEPCAHTQHTATPCIRFSVRDTGIGISPAGQARLFQSFSQADSSTTRKFGGTGLGLAISKQLVALMGGKIGVDSAEGEGSTFWFELPLETAADAPPGKRPAPTETPLSLRVLIVDDRPTDQAILSRYLKSWSMPHEIDADGPAALVRLRTAAADGQAFDVALIDYRMPVMDGLALAQAIRAEPALARLRLVMLTAHDQRDLAEQALDAGFAACLAKPVRQSDLYNSIAAIVSSDDGAPTADSDAPEEKAATTHNLLDALENGRLVLLVEDNPTNQKVAQLQLQKLGYAAHIVGNGQLAVEAVTTLPYAAVLMDCQMPVMDGFEATTQIRKHEAEVENAGRPRMPIIAMTANAMQGDRERCIAVGMDDYVSKPIDPVQLQSALTRWIPEVATRQPIADISPAPLSQTAGKAAAAVMETGVTVATPMAPAVAAPAAVPTPAQTPAQTPAPAAIDLAALADLCGGDNDLVAEIIGIFVATTPALIDKLLAAIDREDRVALKAHAHELKGTSSNLSIPALTAIARELETLAPSGDWAVVRTHSSGLSAAYRSVEAQIEAAGMLKKA